MISFTTLNSGKSAWNKTGSDPNGNSMNNVLTGKVGPGTTNTKTEPKLMLCNNHSSAQWFFFQIKNKIKRLL